MPTKNIECQLAQGQIGRYLSGERFSAQAIKQLESHVADCDECSELVTRRRTALMTMLGEGSTRAAVMATPSASEKSPEAQPAKSAVEKLIAAMGRVEEPVAAPAPTPLASTPVATSAKTSLIPTMLNPKTLTYFGALAAVLLGMSYFSKNALKSFGPTVDSPASLSASITTQPVHTAAPVPATKPATLATSSSAAVSPAPAASTLSTTGSRTKTLPIVTASNVDLGQEDTIDVPATASVPLIQKSIRPQVRIHRKPALAVRRATGPRLRTTRRVVRRQMVENGDQSVRIDHSRIHSYSEEAPSSTSSQIKIYDPQGRSMN